MHSDPWTSCTYTYTAMNWKKHTHTHAHIHIWNTCMWCDVNIVHAICNNVFLHCPWKIHSFCDDIITCGSVLELYTSSHEWVTSWLFTQVWQRSTYRRAGWCAPDLGVPGCTVGGLQQDPGSTASSLSGGMRSERGRVHGQTHGPALWTDQCLQRLGREKGGEMKKMMSCLDGAVVSNIQIYHSFLVRGACDTASNVKLTSSEDHECHQQIAARFRLC